MPAKSLDKSILLNAPFGATWWDSKCEAWAKYEDTLYWSTGGDWFTGTKHFTLKQVQNFKHLIPLK